MIFFLVLFVFTTLWPENLIFAFQRKIKYSSEKMVELMQTEDDGGSFLFNNKIERFNFTENNIYSTEREAGFFLRKLFNDGSIYMNKGRDLNDKFSKNKNNILIAAGPENSSNNQSGTDGLTNGTETVAEGSDTGNNTNTGTNDMANTVGTTTEGSTDTTNTDTGGGTASGSVTDTTNTDIGEVNGSLGSTDANIGTNNTTNIDGATTEGSTGTTNTDTGGGTASGSVTDVSSNLSSSFSINLLNVTIPLAIVDSTLPSQAESLSTIINMPNDFSRFLQLLGGFQSSSGLQFTSSTLDSIFTRLSSSYYTVNKKNLSSLDLYSFNLPEKTNGITSRGFIGYVDDPFYSKITYFNPSNSSFLNYKSDIVISPSYFSDIPEYYDIFVAGTWQINLESLIKTGIYSYTGQTSNVFIGDTSDGKFAWTEYGLNLMGIEIDEQHEISQIKDGASQTLLNNRFIENLPNADNPLIGHNINEFKNSLQLIFTGGNNPLYQDLPTGYLPTTKQYEAALSIQSAAIMGEMINDYNRYISSADGIGRYIGKTIQVKSLSEPLNGVPSSSGLQFTLTAAGILGAIHMTGVQNVIDLFSGALCSGGVCTVRLDNIMYNNINLSYYMALFSESKTIFDLNQTIAFGPANSIFNPTDQDILPTFVQNSDGSFTNVSFYKIISENGVNTQTIYGERDTSSLINESAYPAFNSSLSNLNSSNNYLLYYYNGDSNQTINTLEGNDFVVISSSGELSNSNYTLTINGGDGNDIIYGSPVNKNEIHGDSGNDYLIGGSNNDKIYDGLGTDFMEGGGGADTFYLVQDGKTDYINDFSIIDGDKINLTQGFGSSSNIDITVISHNESLLNIDGTTQHNYDVLIKNGINEEHLSLTMKPGEILDVNSLRSHVE